MFILGLTGSIGMGKTETARMFRRLGVAVYDADAAVHQLLGPNGAAVADIATAFPGTVKSDSLDRSARVDRAALGARVFGKPAALKELESILHPKVQIMQNRFLSRQARYRSALVVLDIPLLLENDGEARTDAIAVVSAPYRIQRWRVLRRPGMSEQKFHNILKQQMPDALKRQRADFIIPAGLGRQRAFVTVKHLVTCLARRQGTCWPPRRRARPRPAGHPSRRPIHARNRS